MNIDHKIDLLNKKKSFFESLLSSCYICPRNCKVDRTQKEIGFCGAQKCARVYSAFLHYGEEPVISGDKGSGTIFFSGCNLKCIYCQNYKFSHSHKGETVTPKDLAQMMLKLQSQGAHNINLVTPTHYFPQIMAALLIGYENGLNIPIVYNTSGFEKEEIITQLNGIIDIYLSDFKYICNDVADKYSKAKNYPEHCTKSTKEMYSQVQDSYQENEILKKGLIIRHLVLPGLIGFSEKILNWIKTNTPKALVSVMFQYQPYFKAKKFKEINRKVNLDEYKKIKKVVSELELDGWVQDFDPCEKLAGVYFKPKFEI